jgi:hypothetical protein
MIGHYGMQERFSFYFLPIKTLLLIATCGISCAQEVPQSKVIQPLPVFTSPQDTSETSASLSEFEGRYKVGNTTCTVVPIKMAFEVKWIKGQGVMSFFFDKTTPEGKSIFVSEDFGKGRDKFIFDDNFYNVGLFLRADGKVFTVERLKDPPKD